MKYRHLSEKFARVLLKAKPKHKPKKKKG